MVARRLATAHEVDTELTAGTGDENPHREAGI
jgi:hypothetical protein